MSRLMLSTTRGKKAASGFRRRLLLECLEDRRLLAVTTYLNDNWSFVADNDSSGTLTVGDTVRNDNDPLAAGSITAEYGIDGFGAVDGYGSLGGSATLQDAVNGTDSGGTLNILPGVYTQTATVVLDDPITILGPQEDVDPRGAARTPGGPNEAVISGGGTVGTILRIAADDVTLSGLEITNSAAGSADMIESLLGSNIANPTLEYNIIHEAAGDEAIQLRSTTGALIQNNRVYRSSGDAINLVNATDGTIRDNLVYDVYSIDAAIYVYGSTGTTIEGNEVYDVHNNDGIKLGSNTGADAALSGGLIENNVVHDIGNGGDGITVYMSGVTVRGNEVYNTRSVHGAIFVQFAVDDVIIEDNDVHDNRNPPPAGGQAGTAGVKIGRSDDTPIFVTVRNNRIVDNDWGILVDGSTALIEGNDLTGNDIGVRIWRGALVDMGTIGVAGASSGLNILTGYSGVAGNYAIQNLNLDASGHPNVKAENNMFGTTDLAAIEAVVFHDVDDPARTVVDFSPAASLVRIIDDGDAGFSTAGSWTLNTASGYNGDIRFSSAGTGSNVATWTFGGVSQGLYRVSATWSAFTNRATNAPYTVSDGTSPFGTVLINQQVAPNDFSDAGGTWEDLGGLYAITSNTIRVQLSNFANNFVIADAIRIERVGEIPDQAPGSQIIIDNGTPGYSTAGSWTTTAGGYQGDYQFAASGTGSSTATWTFTGLPSGLYRVASTWAPFTNRATNAPYSIRDGGTILSTQSVNQQVAPNDFSASGASWEVLGGLYPISSGSLVVRLSNAANNFVIADAVLIQRVGDMLGPEIQVTHGDSEVPDGTGSVFIGATTVGEPVSQTFTVRNLGSRNLTLAEPISVPAGFSVTSSFGSLTVPPGGSTTFTVQLDAAADGTYSGQLSFGNNDANENPFNFQITGVVSGGLIIDNGTPGFSTVGTWTSWPGGFGGDYLFSPRGNGSNVASWTFTGLTSGMYQVAATWAPFVNRATNSPFTVLDGSTALQTVFVNQELPPNDFSTSGADWEILGGLHPITTGTLRVQLTNAANEFVIADAVHVVRISDLPGPPPAPVAATAIPQPGEKLSTLWAIASDEHPGDDDLLEYHTASTTAGETAERSRQSSHHSDVDHLFGSEDWLAEVLL